jgi:phosphate transporter
LEKKQYILEHSTHDLESTERTSLIEQAGSSSTDSVFVPLLDRELRKITIFYESQEKEVLDDLEELEELVKEQEDIGLVAESRYLEDEYDDEDDEDDEDMEGPSPSRSRPGTHRRRVRSLSFTRGSRVPVGKFPPSFSSSDPHREHQGEKAQVWASNGHQPDTEPASLRVMTTPI